MVVSGVAALYAQSGVDSDVAVVGLAGLRLTDFRNYADLKLSLLPDYGVVLCGPNGAGKTNLLEAVSCLGPGKSLRGSRLGAMDRVPGGGPWAVAGVLQTSQGRVDIGCGRIAGEKGNSRRAVRINGVSASGSLSLARHLSIIGLTPEMDRLFSGQSGRRRGFLDRLAIVSIPDHGASVAAYERALRERARLLRDHALANDPAWLAVLEERMAEYGVAIAQTRRTVVGDLNDHCAEYSRACQDDPFPVPFIRLAGEIETWLDRGPALEAEERLRDALKVSRERDAILGGATYGPHRSDWMVYEARRNIRAASCSTGEQKALLISLILASARAVTLVRGAPPLLLLDEVTAHLDERRRNALFACLPQSGQFWLSGLREEDFALLRGRAQFLRVDAGKVIAVPFLVASCHRSGVGESFEEKWRG